LERRPGHRAAWRADVHQEHPRPDQLREGLARTGDIRPWRAAPDGTRQATSYGGCYPHPGYAWAIWRETLNGVGGLIEVNGLRAGDHQMAMGFVGKLDQGIHGMTPPDYQAAVRTWMERAHKFAQGSVGYVQGTLEHAFHGAKDKRQYHERWDILVTHKFNPVTDLKRNVYGVLELAGNKPAMERAFDSYYRQRDEDANVL